MDLQLLFQVSLERLAKLEGHVNFSPGKTIEQIKQM